MSESLQNFRQALEDAAAKLKRFTDAQRRKDGWVPAEEVAAYRAVLAQIRAKTAACPAGQEAATLRAIHQVVGDLLGAGAAGGADDRA